MPEGIFTLEALDAAHGDALLLHYGPVDQPRLIVIDGGPRGIYKKSLAPRLQAIRAARGGGSLEIRMVMVSHIDDDHITGVLDLTGELRKSSEPLPYDILTLWHNSYDDIIAQLGAEAQGFLRAASARKSEDAKAIAASVPQGRQLRADANALSLNLNSGFSDLVGFEGPDTTVDIGAGLSFTVLGPRKTELEALRKDWAKKVKALLKAPKKKVAAKNRGKKKGGAAALEESEVSAADLEALAAEFVDKSIPNLSSIVVLARFGMKSMLLTGDARGDYILESLKEAGLLKNDTMHVDVLKVPHHGSERNLEQSFFESVKADHYVFSADGKFGNPDPPTFGMLFAARPEDAYTLHLTNPVPAALKFITKNKPNSVQLDVRAMSAPSIRVDLATALPF